MSKIYDVKPKEFYINNFRIRIFFMSKISKNSNCVRDWFQVKISISTVWIISDCSIKEFARGEYLGWLSLKSCRKVSSDLTYIQNYVFNILKPQRDYHQLHFIETNRILNQRCLLILIFYCAIFFYIFLILSLCLIIYLIHKKASLCHMHIYHIYTYITCIHILEIMNNF